MDPLTVVLVILGFGGIAVAGARFGAGSTMSITGGLFPRSGQPSWPHGVQEDDAPHFAIERPGVPAGDEAARDDAIATMLEPVPGNEPHWRS
jgi:hypothetical protein